MTCLAKLLYLFLATAAVNLSAGAQTVESGTSNKQTPNPEATDPQKLRAKRGSLEAELVQLRSQMQDRKKELDEVSILEVDLSASGDVGPDGQTLVERIARVPDRVYGGELSMRADDAVNVALLGLRRINTDRFTTLAARKLAVDIARPGNSPHVQTPRECNPTQPKDTPSRQDMDKVVAECSAVVKAAIAEAKKSGAQFPQQETTRVKTALQAEVDRLAKKIGETERSLREVNESIDTSNDLTKTIVSWTIPSLGILLVLILLGPRLYERNIQEEIFSSKLILELLTVYILVSTILILGLANRLQNEVLGTLLGGISGYVLGRALGAAKPNRTESGKPLIGPATHVTT
jgi:outer membrane murein-binding lipoprotein Lpp